LGFSRRILEKYSSNKLYENPYSGSGVVPYERMDTDGRTDRETDRRKKVNRRLSQCCERAKQKCTGTAVVIPKSCNYSEAVGGQRAVGRDGI